jgi:hypothetical protein
VFAGPEHVIVVGERVTVFDARTGERLHDAVRPRGQWIDGALATSPDCEPRLLALTIEGGAASLSALRMSSGVQELVWQEAGVEPRAILPVGGELYVIHSRGVVALCQHGG